MKRGINRMDYSKLDRPEILLSLFHPRKEWERHSPNKGTEDFLIPTSGEGLIGARFYMADSSSPTILFFHGNGEIVSDYDDMAPLFTRMEIGFFAFDYRGYGRSAGHPTVSSMLRDAHEVFAFSEIWLRENGYHGPIIVMGRSLGSACALEIAAYHEGRLKGLIVESGFAHTHTLLELLVSNVDDLKIGEDEGFQNLKKIRSVEIPTLIIHAERDHLLPLSEGRTLYEASPAKEKRMLTIAGADHNDLFFRGMEDYLKAVKTLADSIRT